MKLSNALPSAVLLLAMPSLQAQQNDTRRLFSDVNYQIEAQATVATQDNLSPLWLNANRHGLSSVDKHNGFLRAGLSRPIEADSARSWRIGYGIDAAVAYNFTSSFFVQQLYADAEYRKVRLSVGSKERPMAFKNQELSSGSQTYGINARPIPQIRIELPDYLSLDHGHWIGIKGFFGYGMLTDGNWRGSYARNSYIKHPFYHTKAGYMRLGNEKKFPLVLEGGLEMATVFGGTYYEHKNGRTVRTEMAHGFKQFVQAVYGGGSDPGEGIYANAGGNTVGSWLASLSYKFPTWKIRAYYDHFFEDHSQAFLEYGIWKDGLLGLELTLPRNRFVSTVVFERLSTRDQAGPIYHDHTPEIPDQISAVDNYYNHGTFGGWQHWGQAIGNPLYASPLYFANSSLAFPSNRFNAYHVGLAGDPLASLHYRLLYTYQESWGTYSAPFPDKRYNTSLLAEVRFAPARIGHIDTRGWALTAAFGLDHGRLLGNNSAFQFTLCKQGLLKP